MSQKDLRSPLWAPNGNGKKSPVERRDLRGHTTQAPPMGDATKIEEGARNSLADITGVERVCDWN